VDGGGTGPRLGWTGSNRINLDPVGGEQNYSQGIGAGGGLVRKNGTLGPRQGSIARGLVRKKEFPGGCLWFVGDQGKQKGMGAQTNLVPGIRGGAVSAYGEFGDLKRSLLILFNEGETKGCSPRDKREKMEFFLRGEDSEKGPNAKKNLEPAADTFKNTLPSGEKSGRVG